MNDFTTADLSNADLTGIDLSGTRWSEDGTRWPLSCRRPRVEKPLG
ncbi:pentapeptide repeat-containing protein [Streptomyces sp. NPDC059916]